MMERAAYRSKQHTAADCNQAGQLMDRAAAALGGVQLCARCETDAARDAMREDVAEWMRKKMLPALATSVNA